MSNKLVELARRARTSLGESLHFGLCAELADCVEKLEAKNDKLEQQLAEFEHGLGYEQGKKDGWEACETCHGIVDGKHMEAESLRQQLADRDEQISDLTISSDTYFAERNSARDVWRRASKDRDELRQQLASCDAEIKRLKTVPMRYRRMAFNAQLQVENDQLLQQLADSQKQVTLLRDAMKAAWRDGYAFCGAEGLNEAQKQFQAAFAATEPKP